MRWAVPVARFVCDLGETYGDLNTVNIYIKGMVRYGQTDQGGFIGRNDELNWIMLSVWEN